MIAGTVLRDDSSVMNLGDLSILIILCKQYETLGESQKKRFHEQYMMTEREVQLLFSKKAELEK